MLSSEQSTTSSGDDLTRREFVKTTAAVVGAASLAAPAWAYPAGADTLKVGLIGCGGRGSGAAVQALNADEGVVLWAMADVFDDKLQASHENLQANSGDRVQVPSERRFVGFDSYQQLLASDVDVVILATPPHFRPIHLAAAVEAGKHIFTEKPMAVDAPGVRSVLDSAHIAKQKKLSLVAGFCWRYSLPERATYQQIHDGAIGDIQSMHTTYHTGPLGQRPRQEGWTDMEWQLRNWQHFTWLSGDHIVEQACHAIDWTNWAMNGIMPTKVTGLGGRQMREGLESGDAYDHFSVIYEYENGARCFHTCRQMPGCSNDNTAYIMGTKGTCFVNGWGPTHVIEGEHPWRYEGERKNMYQIEHNELFASIRAGTPMNDGEWMANSTMLAIIGRNATYSGRTIAWEDAMNDEVSLAPPAYEFGDLAMPQVPVPGTPKLF